MLDGLYVMTNGDIIATDWVTGSVFQWNKKMGKHDLTTGFKGPADLCAPISSKARCASSSSANKRRRFCEWIRRGQSAGGFFHHNVRSHANPSEIPSPSVSSTAAQTKAEEKFAN